MSLLRSIAIATTLAIAGTHPPASAQPQRTAAEVMDILMWGREPVGGPFELTDQTGRRRTNEDFRGKLMLIYFGYTYCPDICPTDLQNIGLAIDQLGDLGNAVQPIFISLDPERDSPSLLAEYVPFFHPRLVGLTGEAAAIRKAAKAYKVYFAKANQDGPDSYSIDHTAFIYLMSQTGDYLGFFPPGTTPERIAETVRARLP